MAYRCRDEGSIRTERCAVVGKDGPLGECDCDPVDGGAEPHLVPDQAAIEAAQAAILDNLRRSVRKQVEAYLERPTLIRLKSVVTAMEGLTASHHEGLARQVDELAVYEADAARAGGVA